MPEAADALARNALYEMDFYQWTREQAQLLRERRFEDLDLDNLIDEVEGVGASDRREIESRVEGLLLHLLKWRFQPGGRGTSWIGSVREQRKRIGLVLRDSPSLRSYPAEIVNAVYDGARIKAAGQTGIAIGVFPETCPFTPEQVLDPDFLPEDPGSE